MMLGGGVAALRLREAASKGGPRQSGDCEDDDEELREEVVCSPFHYETRIHKYLIIVFIKKVKVCLH